MCLYIKENEVLVSKTPIVCYKRGSVVQNNFYPLYRMDFNYQKGKITESELKVYALNYIDGYEVEEGLHSCVGFFTNPNHVDTTNHVFIIPKETKYYKGSINDASFKEINGYASEKLIWVGSKWNIITWIKVLKYYLNNK